MREDAKQPRRKLGSLQGRKGKEREKWELKEGKESTMSRKGRMEDGIGKEGRMKLKTKIENVWNKGMNKRRHE